jgi:hypothetical protein
MKKMVPTLKKYFLILIGADYRIINCHKRMYVILISLIHIILQQHLINPLIKGNEPQSIFVHIFKISYCPTRLC